MVNFGGWELPQQYTSIRDEHFAVRKAAGLFDVSHMGRFRVTGNDSFDFLQSLVTNDLGRISEGHGRALAALTIPELQHAALSVVLDRHLSVRQTEELVRRKRDTGTARKTRPITGDLADLEAQLRGLLATRVGIVRTRRGGRLVIEFYSDEELDRLYAIITRGAGGVGA